jgi:hypothetical protein
VCISYVEVKYIFNLIRHIVPETQNSHFVYNLFKCKLKIFYQLLAAKSKLFLNGFNMVLNFYIASMNRSAWVRSFLSIKLRIAYVYCVLLCRIMDDKIAAVNFNDRTYDSIVMSVLTFVK